MLIAIMIRAMHARSDLVAASRGILQGSHSTPRLAQHGSEPEDPAITSTVCRLHVRDEEAVAPWLTPARVATATMIVAVE